MELRFKAEPGCVGAVDADGGCFVLHAAAGTDWFHRPDGSGKVGDAIRASLEMDRPVFSLSARVEAVLDATYDAASIFIAVDEDHWAKLAYERAASGEPTIVSVVTRTFSDDADGPTRPAGPVWLRLHCDGRIVAFHHSKDGRHWRFLRVFTLPGIGRRPLRIGLGAQSPTGVGLVARFHDVRISYDPLPQLRDGS